MIRETILDFGTRIPVTYDDQQMTEDEALAAAYVLASKAIAAIENANIGPNGKPHPVPLRIVSKDDAR